MLIKPILTEKSYANTAFDRFVFQFDRHATKSQIKKLVEAVFKVNVLSVNTALVKPSFSRSGRTGKYHQDRGFKKAIVRLKSGQKIKLFNT